MALDESIIAKLALFERCTDESAIGALNALVAASPSGRVERLAELEAITDTSVVEELPKEWQKYPEFVADWLKLDPPLRNVDLRPAIYLSKETMPVKLARQRIGGKTMRAIETLLKTATFNSPASKAALGEIDASEIGEAMDEIIANMKRNPDWRKARSDFRGACLLARSHQLAREKLVSFVKTLPGERPRWMAPMMRSEIAEPSGGNG